MPPGLTHVGVVVPARDEAELLPGCLLALKVAYDRARRHGLHVHVVVVLDRCTDRSAEVVDAAPWAYRIDVEFGNVGAARQAGARSLFELADGVAPDQLWLATTDADSQVPPQWLVGMAELAGGGAELVVGTVSVDDWGHHPDGVRDRWRAGYARTDPHVHVHGANLGMTGSAYLAAGGFPAAALGEDVALVEASTGRRVVRTTALPVLTSGRAVGRVSGGFADYLRALADGAEAG